ncbi:MAG: pyridoxamine 5'-phosphate oxidase family protein [Geminocystis sp.]|nr:pyridoxamine 5'-phosphate oxidase family protein [Geminocystis sp.]HIK36818.1 pyridoxamine 5'-phosphate oxidase family protein [Geminocystis sp. M7585_C2015_104]MCS7148723.1 pyridoxamine 5'-phosphate oxidase family protein [Geminocystis sp.]MCX8078403.1 pyridoxamine 5'-phosphate oxidase family protein [Geminocystis sp.]MDW8116128.1 pyridoxamine 5'-phosphate oxidase family protein [Geminocystis sp.]
MCEEIAPWRPVLEKALRRNREVNHSKYIQLATVTAQGYPANRTVVFRGFLENTNYLQMVTDKRSQKYEDLKINPMAEICWYFTKTREQFRIRGVVRIVEELGDDSNVGQEEIRPYLEARRKAWENLSDNGKEQFFWPTPGKERKKKWDWGDWKAEATATPANFCLLLLQPLLVDHLQLRGNPQNRYIYTLKGGKWEWQEVNP